MSAQRRVYRATAVYEVDEVTRHFLTKRARDHWADARRRGYEEEPGGLLDDGRPAIPPAIRVDVADSDPITWPS